MKEINNRLISVTDPTRLLFWPRGHTMWGRFEDLTSCPALARRSDSLLLFDERRPLQTVEGWVRGGVEGHRRTLFGVFLQLRLPYNAVLWVRTRSPSACTVRLRLLVILKGSERSKDREVRSEVNGWMNGVFWWAHLIQKRENMPLFQLKINCWSPIWVFSSWLKQHWRKKWIKCNYFMTSNNYYRLLWSLIDQNKRHNRPLEALEAIVYHWLG